MKKIGIIILIIMCLFLNSCTKASSDAKKFQKEYESLNKETDSSGKDYFDVNISADNKFAYITVSEIKAMIEDKETFALFIGNATDAWSRQSVQILYNVAKNMELENIYYLDSVSEDIASLSNSIDIDIKIPTIVSVKKGKVADYVNSISSLKEDPYKNLDDNLNNELSKKIEKVLQSAISNSCSSKTAC